MFQKKKHLTLVAQPNQHFGLDSALFSHLLASHKVSPNENFTSRSTAAHPGPASCEVQCWGHARCWLFQGLRDLPLHPGTTESQRSSPLVSCKAIGLTASWALMSWLCGRNRARIISVAAWSSPAVAEDHSRRGLQPVFLPFSDFQPDLESWPWDKETNLTSVLSNLNSLSTEPPYLPSSPSIFHSAGLLEGLYSLDSQTSLFSFSFCLSSPCPLSEADFSVSSTGSIDSNVVSLTGYCGF